LAGSGKIQHIIITMVQKDERGALRQVRQLLQLAYVTKKNLCDEEGTQPHFAYVVIGNFQHPLPVNILEDNCEDEERGQP